MSARKQKGIFLRQRSRLLSFLTYENVSDDNLSDDEENHLRAEKIAYFDKYGSFEKMNEAIQPLLDKLVAEGADFEDASFDLMGHYITFVFREMYGMKTVPNESLAGEFLSINGDYEFFLKKWWRSCISDFCL